MREAVFIDSDIQSGQDLKYQQAQASFWEHRQTREYLLGLELLEEGGSWK